MGSVSICQKLHRTDSKDPDIRGFDPPLRRMFSGKGDFSLGVNIGSDSSSQKLFWMRV